MKTKYDDEVRPPRTRTALWRETGQLVALSYAFIALLALVVTLTEI